MKTVLVLMYLLLLVGCTTNPFVLTAVDHAAKANDELRVSAEWTLCNAISIGAWKRAYANDSAKADAWRNLCASPMTEMPGVAR